MNRRRLESAVCYVYCELGAVASDISLVTGSDDDFESLQLGVAGAGPCAAHARDSPAAVRLQTTSCSTHRMAPYSRTPSFRHYRHVIANAPILITEGHTGLGDVAGHHGTGIGCHWHRQ